MTLRERYHKEVEHQRNHISMLLPSAAADTSDRQNEGQREHPPPEQLGHHHGLGSPAQNPGGRLSCGLRSGVAPAQSPEDRKDHEDPCRDIDGQEDEGNDEEVKHEDLV